ncbi:hypothetical protein BTVI_53696 [Pitangus sulphuratus]|nr:hypothetical protein BTVI_53696 [Pitangus sulphuratus]
MIILRDQSDQERCLRKKANVALVFKKGKKKDPGNYWPLEPHHNPWKGTGASHSGGHLHVDDKKVVRSMGTKARFSTLSLRKCGVDEWTVRWIENWLNSRFQRVVISDTGSSWRPVTSGVPQVSSMTWMKGQMPSQQIF